MCESSSVSKPTRLWRGLGVGFGGFDAFFRLLVKRIQVHAVILRVVIVALYVLHDIPKVYFDYAPLLRVDGSRLPVESVTATTNAAVSMRETQNTMTDNFRISREYLKDRFDSLDKIE